MLVSRNTKIALLLWTQLVVTLPTVAQEADVLSLIADLGSDKFVVRERARRTLMAEGQRTIDALWDAKRSADPEIRVSIDALLRRITPPLDSRSAPPQVRQLLQEYHLEPIRKRKTRIDRLAQLPGNLAVPPLCRLVKYEPSELLSDFAAVCLIRKKWPASIRADLADQIECELGKSTRDGAQLLQSYCTYLRDPDQLESELGKFVDARLGSHAKELDSSIFLESTLWLARWCADRAIETGKIETANRIATALVERLPDSEAEMSRCLSWLMRHEMWTALDRFSEVHESTIAKRPLMLMQIAESWRRRSDPKLAERRFRQAMAAIKIDDQPLLALRLERMGMPALAEQTYREFIGTATPNSPQQIRARLLYSQLLSDHQRYAEASEQLAPVVDWIEFDPDNQRALKESTRRTAKRVMADHQYLLSLGCRGGEDINAELTHLLASLQYDPDHADALIALFRYSNRYPEFRPDANLLIDRSLRAIREELERKHQILRLTPQPFLSHSLGREVARLANRWAWIASNTDRGVGQAIEYAKLAIALQPEMACFHDTLARCHYSAGRLDRASIAQGKAVELAPYCREFQMHAEFYQQVIRATPVARIFE